jgi:beta-lactamase class A
MKFRLSARPLLAMVMSAVVLAGCVSSAAIVPQPRAQKPSQAVRGPAGSVTVPIGQPVRSAMPRPAGPTDPGFRRAPAGLNDRLYALWRAFPGKTGIAVQRIDGEWTLSQRGDELFPQQSVSKLWVALTVLDAVDQGRVTMDQRLPRACAPRDR